MRVHIELIVTHVCLEYQPQVTALVVLLERLHILVMLVLALDSRVLLLDQIERLVNQHFHLGFQKS